MRIEDFNNLNNFSTAERNAFNDPLYKAEDFGKINLELMIYVDSLTSFIKTQFKERNPVCIIHCITSGTHKEDSQHYLGRAVDCHFESLSLYEQFMMASLFPFTGIGYYPYSLPTFVHLDIKDIGNRLNRRIWYRDSDGTYVGIDDLQEVLNKLRKRKVCYQNDSD